MIVSRYRGYGGHEIVINNLCKGLAKLGHEVSIGAFFFDKNPPPEIHMVRLKRFHAWEWLHDASFDIYHSHQTQVNYYSLLSNKPFIFHCHGASSSIQEINLRLCMILCKQKISRTICVSKSCLKQFHTITNCEAEIIYNGVDTLSLNPSLRRPYTKGDPQLLFVGNLYPHKNVGGLILMMMKIIREYPKAQLQIVGTGDDHQNISSLIEKHDLKDHVDILGSSSEEDLKHRIASCDIYVSASEWEMFGLPVLEAMACAKPVLLSDIPAHRELIESSGGGLIFSLDNTDGITKKIADLCSRSKDIGNKGREFAEKCDWHVACENLSKMYNVLLNR
jgi:glycosyltransferase involved in cell wall biosynthesis